MSDKRTCAKCRCVKDATLFSEHDPTLCVWCWLHSPKHREDVRARIRARLDAQPCPTCREPMDLRSLNTGKTECVHCRNTRDPLNYMPRPTCQHCGEFPVPSDRTDPFCCDACRDAEEIRLRWQREEDELHAKGLCRCAAAQQELEEHGWTKDMLRQEKEQERENARTD